MSILVILAWFGINYAIYFLIKNRWHKIKVAEIFLQIELGIGALGSVALGTVFGYKSLMFLVFLLLPLLWGLSVCIYKISEAKHVCHDT